MKMLQNISYLLNNLNLLVSFKNLIHLLGKMLLQHLKWKINKFLTNFSIN